MAETARPAPTPFQRRQIDFLVFLQRAIGLNKRRPFPALLRAVSVLGTGHAIFPVCVILTWFIDFHRGIVAQKLLVFSLLVMASCKTFFRMPRPYFVSDRITHLDPTREASFGFPSGHTLCMVSMLGYAAMSYGSPWGVVAYVTMVVLTCISRLYTGAHFVVDVVGGFVFGAGILAIALMTDLEWCTPRVMLAIAAVLFGACLSIRDTTGSVFVKRVAEAYQGTGLACGLALGQYLATLDTSTHPSTAGPVAGVVAFAVLAGLVLAEYGYLKQRLTDSRGARKLPALLIGVAITAIAECWCCWGVPCVLNPMFV